MSPKFRGSSDDWLDDHKFSAGKSSSGRQKRAQGKTPEATAKELSLEDSNAVVSEVFPNQCRIRLNIEKTELLCSYRRAGVISKAKEDYRERSPVAVGDRVLVELLNPQCGVIKGICKRTNSLSRLAPGREGGSLLHVLAANIDLLVIVASANQPEFSMGLVDRFLIASEMEKIRSLICITKMDLFQAPQEKPWEIYQEIGYQVVEVASKAGLGLDTLKAELEGKTVVFCGQSGVGKTSLLRILTGKEIGRVGEVNERTGKGRHTTTGAMLLEGPSQSYWIDTPGVKEFGLVRIAPQSLASLFPEFMLASCPIQGCLHQDEPECSIKDFVRYPSYKRMLESVIEEHAKRQKV